MTLLPGEKILWQGRPEARAPLDVSRPSQLLFGVVFVAFSMVWMDKARESGSLIWLAGFVFMGLGLKLSVWRAWQPRLRAKFARYTLTDRRALAEMRWPLIAARGAALTLSPSTIIDIEGHDPATLSFTQSGLAGREGARSQTLRFERIAEARHVLALARDVQKGAA